MIVLYLFIHVMPPVTGSVYLIGFTIIYLSLLILCNNGFLVSVLSSNSLVLLYVFQPFWLEKGGILASISAGIIVDIFISIYRVILWGLWETTNCSKLGNFLGVSAKLCGFLGGRKRVF